MMLQYFVEFLEGISSIEEIKRDTSIENKWNTVVELKPETLKGLNSNRFLTLLDEPIDWTRVKRVKITFLFSTEAALDMAFRNKLLGLDLTRKISEKENEEWLTFYKKLLEVA